MRGAVRIVYVGLGCLCTALGILGIFLPLVPTTPLLLLAAFFFARSSRRFYGWLVNHRWFGRPIRDFRDGVPMPAGELAITLAVMWTTVIATAFLVVPVWWGRASMIAISGGVTIYLVTRNRRLRSR